MNQPTDYVIRKAMRDFNLTSLMVSPARDSSLMLPEESWIREFGEWIRGERLRLPSYSSQSWDCDDYSLWASVEASKCRALASGDSGHSVFVCYITGNRGRELNGLTFGDQLEHSCLIILDSTEKWWFLEPQNGSYAPALENLVDDSHPNRAVVSVDYLIL